MGFALNLKMNDTSEVRSNKNLHIYNLHYDGKKYFKLQCSVVNL